ncbi:MAG: helix-turn-helix transcriptional regulator [Cyanobacteria bacterium J06621_15]
MLESTSIKIEEYIYVSISKVVIRWKLNEMMARSRVKNKDLAKALGISEVSMYKLRKVDEMPRLAPQRLEDICIYLKCQPGDLLVLEADEEVAKV